MGFSQVMNFLESSLNPPLISSRQQNWENIVIEQFYQPPGQLETLYPSDHTICLCLAPSPFLLLQVKDGKVHEGLHAKGDISVTPAGMPFLERWDRDDSYLKLHLASNFVQKVAAETFEMNSDRMYLLPEFRARDSHIEYIGSMFLSELKNGGLGGKLYIESLTNLLAVHLIRNYSTSKPRVFIYDGGLSERQLLQVTDFINENLNHKITVGNIAKSLDMSLFHFSRLFKQSMGISPYQYLIQQRLERAKKLLRQKEVTIADVALQCGFNSHSHLGYWFRKLIGVTPKTYRRSKL